MQSKDIVHIWDSEEIPPCGAWISVLWRSFGDESLSDYVSIPEIIEKQSDILRSIYLSWVYSFGEVNVDGKRLIDHLEIRPGFSYWWMTLIAEKCNFAKSKQITDAIRLLAFKLWLDGQSVRQVVLQSSNSALAECLHSLCVNMEIAFHWQRLPVKRERKKFVKQLYQYIPKSFKAGYWLVRYFVERWPLKGVGLQEWRQTKNQTTFISYFDNLVPDAASAGRFQSRYWGNLPDELQRTGCDTNWLHIYVPDALVSSAEKAADYLSRFNKSGATQCVHVTMDTFLGVKVFFRSLRDRYRLERIGRYLQNDMSVPYCSSIDLWPLFKDDWQQSMFGITAIRNLLFLNLFESALSHLPECDTAVYLQENMDWEFALNYAWRASGHSRLIGTAPGLVRFWDLRYFFDPRIYLKHGVNQLPLPDFVAVNGHLARESYLAGGYPKDQLVDVEALRYLHFESIREHKVSCKGTMALSTKPLRLLVLGDYLPYNTRQQMHLLNQSIPLLTVEPVVMVKPHPNCPIAAADYPGIHMELTSENLTTLLSGCDVAYTSSATAAGVDAYCFGVPVVSVLDANTLNLSPLQGCRNVHFITNAVELSQALMAVHPFSSGPNDRAKEYFFLDYKLTRWFNLLSERFL